MSNTSNAISAAVSGILALGMLGSPLALAGDDDKMDKEKCYGVAAAGKNDCQTANSSCAGTAEKDRQADAFIVVPKGLCDKIAGGSTEPQG